MQQRRAWRERPHSTQEPRLGQRHTRIRNCKHKYVASVRTTPQVRAQIDQLGHWTSLVSVTVAQSAESGSAQAFVTLTDEDEAIECFARCWDNFAYEKEQQ